MRQMKLRNFLITTLAVALIALLAMVALPHDKYLRYQTLNDHTAPNAYWIYQRIHNDPTPIDIAFLGTSRTGRSVHTERLEHDLAEHGVHAKAVNFHIVKTGRDMHYVIAKELLTHRQVKLLILEMTELEDRTPHPDFIFLADPEDVIAAPLFINLRYFYNLARLPGRQIDLFLETRLDKFGLRTPEFAPPLYQGPNLDWTEYLDTIDGKRHALNTAHSYEDMEKLRQTQEAAITPAMLPKAFEKFEFRVPRYYIESILALAKQRGTKVVFLYTPRYAGPHTPPPYDKLYAQRAELIDPEPLLHDFHLWADDTHVNWSGSKILTDYLAEAIVRGSYLQQ
jgi:hypothetical protein